MKACVFTLGCKVNEVEGASIMSTLEDMGFSVTDRLESADIYILNTCAVTAEAERKSRQLVARARKFNPSARVYVLGCASERDRSPFEMKGVDGVFGTGDREGVIRMVAESESLGYCGRMSYPKQTKTRAFVKIEDGCDSFCSYCIIPYLRGRVTSRPISDIVDEVRSLDSREVVLTGINMSAYDAEGGLTALIRALKWEDIRIRLGSLECGIIDGEFLDALSSLKDFAPQFHLSLQSGSNRVLKAMNRHYTREEFLGKCSAIYDAFPGAAVTTDMIAGFPAETEEDFAGSLSIIEEAGFARVHAFPFSPREGTAAYRMKDIPADTKKRRLDALLEAGKRAEDRYIRGMEGKGGRVIWEETSDGYTSGYTGNYIRVYAGGRREGMEDIVIGERFRDGALVRE